MTTSEVRQEKREELQKLEAGLKRAEAQYAAEREVILGGMLICDMLLIASKGNQCCFKPA